MKFIVSLLLASAFLISTSFAGINGENLQAEHPELEHFEIVDSVEGFDEIKIKDIKNYVYNYGPTETCLDEMLKRRNQLFIKLAFIPAVFPVAIYAYPITFGFAGVLIGFATGKPGADFAGFFLGVLAGGVYYTVDTTITTTKTIKSIIGLNLISKALAEQYIQGGGYKSQKLYKLYLNQASANPMSERAFFDKLLESDRSGLLCDGTMVTKRPRVFKKLRSRYLKFRVATSKDFINYLLAE